MQDTMKLLVMGTGALGGYFGGRLAAQGHDVTFVARGQQLQALKENGLRLESPMGDLHLPHVQATDRPEGNPDVVLLMVKNRDVEAAGTALLPILKPGGAVLTVQNGVSAPERLGRIIGPERVIGGSVFMPADVKAPGVIRQSSDFSIVRAGVGPGGPAKKCDALIAALCAAGVDAAQVDDIDKLLWEKLIFLGAYSALTALTRLDIGPLRTCPETRLLLRRAVEEAAAVGTAIGIRLDDDVVETQFDRLDNGVPANSHASMLDDLNRGKPLELEYLSGEIVRLGAEQGIDTPVHAFVCAALAPFADGAPG